MANSMKPKPDDDRCRCKKHPKHRQSPGVCSICLSERLSRLLSSTKFSRKISDSLSSSASSSSSLSSYYSSASSCSSPINRDELYRYGYGIDRRKTSMYSSLFKKSRSMAFENDNGKKNGGFWSKFLGRGSRRKGMEEGLGLTHSRTMVQRLHG